MEKEYFEIPNICPICGGLTEIIQEIDSEMLYCANSQCEGKLVNRIEHFFGKKGLDAKGISKATIEKLIDWGWIGRASDMFTLSTYAEEWKNIQGFGEKSVSNILQSIETCRNCIFESVISAAGIPLIGRTVARDLSKRFKSYSDFREAIKTNFDFAKFGGYGYEMHKALTTFDYSELDYIVENYLNIQDDAEEEKTQVLEGLTFCVTGKVKQVKNRDELKKIIEQYGGKVVDSVSKNVKYLINNDSTSTSAKNKKAIELNIPIISEEKILEMCYGKN